MQDKPAHGRKASTLPRRRSHASLAECPCSAAKSSLLSAGEDTQAEIRLSFPEDPSIRQGYSDVPGGTKDRMRRAISLLQSPRSSAI
jgi:hypothetical protein